MKNSQILKAQSTPIGTQKPGITRRQKLWIAALVLIFLALIGLLIASTMQINELRNAGKGYYTLVPGSPGVNGKSAYDLAVDNGFKGSQLEWLQTLQGQIGPQGETGLSAYQLAQIQGYLGSQTDWLNSLVGDRGKSAYETAVDNGFKGTQLEWLASLIGAKGDAGAAGQNGATGPQGEAGLSAYAIAVLNGFNGTQQQWIASLKGADGTDGTDARQPVISCIVRSNETPPTQYVAWKYTDEADTAYRNLYQLPVWAQGQNCVEAS